MRNQREYYFVFDSIKRLWNGSATAQIAGAMVKATPRHNLRYHS
jgi:hypothetical protein